MEIDLESIGGSARRSGDDIDARMSFPRSVHIHPPFIPLIFKETRKLIAECYSFVYVHAHPEVHYTLLLGHRISGALSSKCWPTINVLIGMESLYPKITTLHE